MTPVQIGKYRIDSPLGEGAMGIVYRGHDTQSGTTVAVKTIKLAAMADGETREMLERFKREGSAGAKLSHPNVVKIHEYGETEGLAYIVMDFVAGESLRTLNGRRGRWPLFEALQLADQLLDAVDYFHKRGIVHRDIKPSNIMVDAQNHLTVTDLGIVRTENSTLTQVGTVLGSPWYMSPEQITEMPLDSRSDLFSVGIILYELITGRNPFKADQLIAVLDNIVTRPLQPPSLLAPDLPPAVDKLFERALAKKPQERFQSGAEFRSALRQMLAELLPHRDSAAGWEQQAPAGQPAPPPSAVSIVPQTGQPDPKRSPEAAAMLAAIELGMHDHETRGKPRSRALLWLIVGLAFSGLLILFQSSTPAPPRHLTPQLPGRTSPPVQDTTRPRSSPQAAEVVVPAPGEVEGKSGTTATDQPPAALPASPSSPASEHSQEEERTVAAILRQCEDGQIERVLIPNVNGIVRCNKGLICTWDAAALLDMHRRLSEMLSAGTKQPLSGGSSSYLAEIGCVTGLANSPVRPVR